MIIYDLPHLLLPNFLTSSDDNLSIIRIVRLILDVGEQGESAGTQAVKLVLQEHHLFLLLLDDVEHASLLRNRHDLLQRIISIVLVRGRLQVYDLLPLVDFHAQISSLALQLRFFTLLVLYLHQQLSLLVRVSLEPIGRILARVEISSCLPDLVLKSLLISLILLLVLALDDLLSLLGHAVELHIQRALLLVLDLERLALHNVLDLLQFGLVGQNLLHLLNLAATLSIDVRVLLVNGRLVDENRILVIESHR